jgi:hypothetical protein
MKHDLPKFELKISWKHANVFCHQATQPFANKRCAIFCFTFLIMELLKNPKVYTLFKFSNLVQIKQIKAYF